VFNVKFLEITVQFAGRRKWNSISMVVDSIDAIGAGW
jgi:hypothetical protein